MTYSQPHMLRGLGASGDRFSVGQEVTARFTPQGVNASNQAASFAALSGAMARTGVFYAPTYVGWGAGENAGLVIFKAKTKSDAFTAVQVANKLPAVVAEVARALGAPRLVSVGIRHPIPSGPAAAAAASDAPGAPGAPAEGGSAAPYAPSGEGSEAPGFFTRTVGGVPVWAVGAGVLLLGGGLVFVATRKKAPAALTANRRRTKRLAANPKRQELEAAVAAGEDLTFANLEGARLRGADLARAKLMGANLEGANLERANLLNANLAYANLEGAILVDAILERANLEHANLLGAYLGDADLTFANLVDANLTRANMIGAKLRYAKLRGAILSGATLPGAYLTGADLTGAILERAHLRGAVLHDAHLRGANLYEANLAEADLTRATLTGAYLERADLRGANLTGANLRDAKLMGADLRRANLTGATMTGAILRGADLRDVYYDSSTVWPDDFTPPPSRNVTKNPRSKDSTEGHEAGMAEMARYASGLVSGKSRVYRELSERAMLGPVWRSNQTAAYRRAYAAGMAEFARYAAGLFPKKSAAHRELLERANPLLLQLRQYDETPRAGTRSARRLTSRRAPG